MADNEYVNKVETADGTVLMDITDSTVGSGTMLRGVVAYGATGERLVGALGNATQSSDGLMSAADKAKLDGVASGAEVNVQADWAETNSNSDAYILNKPTLGSAAEKNVDASVSAGTSSANLPTSKAVSDYVEDVASRPFFTTFGFSIAVSDWTGSGPYTCDITNSAVGANTTIDVYPDYDGCGDVFAKLSWQRTQNGTGPDFYWTPLSNGVRFIVNSLPTGTITGTVRVLGSSSDHRMVMVSDDVIPIAKGGTNATNAAGARVNLGLGAVENKSSATIRSEITQANVNQALGTGSGTTKYYREDGTWATPPNTTYSDATTSAAGLMSASDKTKLNGIASGATANTVENVLTSTSTTNALSAAQGKALNDSKAPISSPNFQGSISVDGTNVPVSNPEHGIGFGTCATAAATDVKAVTLSGFALRNGAVCAVRFTYAVLAGAKLNVNSTGSKDIYYHGSAITANKIKAGDLGVFMYDDTNYHLIAVDSAATHQLKWGDLYST